MVNVPERILFLYPTSRPFHDWQVEQIAPTEQRIARWNPALGPEPTEAELAAVTPAQIASVPVQQATLVAQQEKAEATKGVDDALTKTGGRVERAVMSVAYSISKAENNTRLALFQVGNAIRDATTFADLKVRIAAITFPQEVTPQQVADAVKAAIAATPE